MKHTNKKGLFLIATIIITMVIFVQSTVFAQIVTYGSDPDMVGQVQRRLKEWGYYDYNIDGHFGWRTEQAIRSFQAKNGINVDGVAGSQTLEGLGLGNLSNQQNSGGGGNRGASSTRSEARLLAQCVSGEARGEPYVGQVAVAAVILNRTNDANFPNTISGVIYQPGAFDAVADGQIYMEPSESSVKAANDALAGWDPSGGAIYYYNPVTSTNRWILSREIINEIGKHVFAR